MAGQVRAHLEQVNELVAAPEADESEPAEPAQSSLV